MPVPNSFANVTTSIPLSQLDANFNTPITLGNTAIQLGNTVTTLNNMTLANATVSSGNVTVTSASVSGNLTFTGTGNRILGDFSNGTIANRVMFQTSSAGSNSVISAIPNGAATQASFVALGNSTPTNASYIQMLANGATDTRIISSYFGSGTSLPMTFYTGGSERMRIDTSGNVGIGTSSLPSGSRLAVVGGGIQLSGGTTAQEGIRIQRASGYASITGINNDNNTFNPIAFFTSGTEAVRIDTSGNVLVTNPAGLGYGTGSGGTVTQATNKSTAVTLNKPTGQITMNNAALAANTTVTFQLTNSVAATTDGIVLTFFNGGVGSSANYLIWGAAQSGSVIINVRNISGGSLSEAIVINFAIIKGATS